MYKLVINKTAAKLIISIKDTTLPIKKDFNIWKNIT